MVSGCVAGDDVWCGVFPGAARAEDAAPAGALDILDGRTTEISALRAWGKTSRTDHPMTEWRGLLNAEN